MSDLKKLNIDPNLGPPGPVIPMLDDQKLEEALDRLGSISDALLLGVIGTLSQKKDRDAELKLAKAKEEWNRRDQENNQPS